MKIYSLGRVTHGKQVVGERPNQRRFRDPWCEVKSKGRSAVPTVTLPVLSHTVCWREDPYCPIDCEATLGQRYRNEEPGGHEEHSSVSNQRALELTC